MLRTYWWFCLLTLALIGRGEATAQDQKAADRLRGLWADLASEDESKANRALLAMSATPKETLAFLQAHLRAVKVEPERVAALVDDLNSDVFAKRTAATEELKYLGKYAKPLLEKHLKENKSVEVTRRLEQVIALIPPDPKAEKAKTLPAMPPPRRGQSVRVSNINGKIIITIDGQQIDLDSLTPPPTQPGRPNPGWLRATRVVALLEHLATPEATRLLQTVADGEGDAPPTKAAREALERGKLGSSPQEKNVPKKL